ncbi:MAG: exodeoxyribonuclease III [Alphaproteobacteria bacterium]|nr:exodeoxyribonuclease III [Alphaproteobacteria bacterium]
MSLKIASWNVNSILARLPTALAVLKEIDVDVVCLQEIKCEDDRFPRLEIEAMGYNVETHGQKTYNGVAILSKHRIEEVEAGLPGGDGDSHSRYIEAVISAPEGPVRVISLYAPNGNPIGTEKFSYKLAWHDRLIARAQTLLALEEPLVLAGDYNIIPRADDADAPEGWKGDALFQPESIARYRALLNMGMIDAFMQADGRARQFTFWDYQAGAWRRDHGIRIDHLVLSPQAADRLQGVRIHKDARAMEKPSDHVPIIGTFDL